MTIGSGFDESVRGDVMAVRRLFVFCIVLAAAAPVSAGGPGDSVVRVSATVRDPDLLRPWIRQRPVQISGSGAVIEDKQILTNAHTAPPMPRSTCRATARKPSIREFIPRSPFPATPSCS